MGKCKAAEGEEATTTSTETDELGRAPSGSLDNAMGKGSIPTPKKQETIEEQMGFAAWAPEVINGRLAMLGIISGLGAELAKGESIPTQFAEHFGAFLGSSIVIVAASFTLSSLEGRLMTPLRWASR